MAESQTVAGLRPDVQGAILVTLAAISWSFGGILARLADTASPWTTVFWRMGSASILIMVFMLWRDGPRGMLAQFRQMGWPGLFVACCFAVASTCFIIALQFTTVANALLMQAGVPLIAALFSWLLFREPVRGPTWIAIAAVIFGMAVMVSDSLTGRVSPVGDALALTIAVCFAMATVVTRRWSDIRMTPAVFTGSAIGFLVALAMTGASAAMIAVTPLQFGLLLLFGASFAAGLVLFTTGARLIASSMAALLSTAETVLGPLWVFLVVGETPTPRTIVGGSIVLVSLLCYLAWQSRAARRQRRIIPQVQ